MKPKQIIVAGIGTEIGKTVISSLLVHAWQAAYWKPVQSGTETDSDTDTVRSLSQSPGPYFPNTYALKAPLSPHTAAKLEGVNIELKAFALPQWDGPLVVELAGGLMVPLNDQETNVDLIQDLGLPVLLVSKNYLGSINHTLLSYELLKAKGIPILGLVFNGPSNPSGEAFIERYTQLPVWLRLPETPTVDLTFIQQYAQQIP